MHENVLVPRKYTQSIRWERCRSETYAKMIKEKTKFLSYTQTQNTTVILQQNRTVLFWLKSIWEFFTILAIYTYSRICKILAILHIKRVTVVNWPHYQKWPVPNPQALSSSLLHPTYCRKLSYIFNYTQLVCKVRYSLPCSKCFNCVTSANPTIPVPPTLQMRNGETSLLACPRGPTGFVSRWHRTSTKAKKKTCSLLFPQRCRRVPST